MHLNAHLVNCILIYIHAIDLYRAQILRFCVRYADNSCMNVSNKYIKSFKMCTVQKRDFAELTFDS